MGTRRLMPTCPHPRGSFCSSSPCVYLQRKKKNTPVSSYFQLRHETSLTLALRPFWSRCSLELPSSHSHGSGSWCLFILPCVSPGAHVYLVPSRPLPQDRPHTPEPQSWLLKSRNTLYSLIKHTHTHTTAASWPPDPLSRAPGRPHDSKLSPGAES